MMGQHINDDTIIAIANFCKHDGWPAIWDAKKEKWLCPTTNKDDCIETYYHETFAKAFEDAWRMEERKNKKLKKKLKKR